MAIKKRNTTGTAPRDISAAVEQFAAGADQQPAKLDPNAARDYKALSLPLNQYEYEQLEAGCAISGRSKLNFIRQAILKFARELQAGES